MSAYHEKYNMQLFSLYYEILTYIYYIVLRRNFFVKLQKHLVTFFICSIEIKFYFMPNVLCTKNTEYTKYHFYDFLWIVCILCILCIEFEFYEVPTFSGV